MLCNSVECRGGGEIVEIEIKVWFRRVDLTRFREVDFNAPVALAPHDRDQCNASVPVAVLPATPSSTVTIRHYLVNAR